jgi:catechol 2,3-dioxygenase-like lactoylglutathione lyase family enzyme
VRIDHVIYATADLDAAAARIRAELGLEAAGGGRHEGHGTHNRIVPLGGGYLELLAVADPDEAAASPIGEALEAHLADRGEGLFAWAVAVEDVQSVADRLGEPIVEVRRQGVSARLVGVADALGGSALPFFIERDQGIADPGADGGAGGITWVELACDPIVLGQRLGDSDLPLRLVGGEPGLRAMGIGDRELRPA